MKRYIMNIFKNIFKEELEEIITTKVKKEVNIEMEKFNKNLQAEKTQKECCINIKNRYPKTYNI